MNKWIKFDLHTHSIHSRERKQSDKSRTREMSASDFNDIILSKKVHIFSVTDHNYFSAGFYRDLLDDIVTRKLELAIIPGVEFDCYIDGDNNKYFHSCIYFSNSVNFDQLEKAVNELYVDKNNNLLYPSVFEIIDKLYNLKSKFIVIPHGDKSSGLFELIRKTEITNKDEFYKYAMYKIFSGFDVKPGFYKNDKNHWDADFFEHSKECTSIMESYHDETYEELEAKISSKIKNDDSVLNEKEQKVFDYINKYGHFYAYFSFSDWHNKEPYNLRINNFLYGSLELPFESFELATLDPISRVEVTKDEYIEIPDSLISNVSFTLNGIPHSIDFSCGLNAIVGKRGSGKSLLVSIIRNLVDENDDNGAIKVYSKLKPNNIKVKDMKGIETGVGSLDSAVFLSQDEISKIFKDPNNASEGIKQYFPKSPKIDISELLNIKNLLIGIKPYNSNFKNITNYINGLKNIKDYTYNNFELYEDSEFKNNCQLLSEYAEKIKLEFSNNYLDMTTFNLKLNDLKNTIKDYWSILGKYKSVVGSLNEELNNINKLQNVNQQIAKNNLSTLNDVIKNLISDFDKQLCFEKLKYTLDHFTFENPQVAIYIKNKYLFASYYEIPNNFAEDIKDIIFANFVRPSRTWDDIKEYLNGKIELKKSVENISSSFEKYLESDLFKSKSAFYEMKSNNINYKEEITDYSKLINYCNDGSLLDLSKTSLGMQSVVYLDLLFSLDGNILVLDQPEDNIDNDYISMYLVPNIKKSKKVKQLIFVTHNPSIAVYGDAFNYIYVSNEQGFDYKNYYIEKLSDKEKLLDILDGGRKSFSNRNKKYGYILGENSYEN